MPTWIPAIRSDLFSLEKVPVQHRPEQRQQRGARLPELHGDGEGGRALPATRNQLRARRRARQEGRPEQGSVHK